MLKANDFEALVGEALDELPPFFQTAMRNVVVLVSDWPTAEELDEAGVGPGDSILGLYYGIPLTERTQGYNMVPPDTITLYQGPIEETVAAVHGRDGTYRELVRAEVRHTVIHEIAHHFGISDDRLSELGAY